MELSVLALQAVNIALWAIDKSSGGALEKAGSDVLDFLRGKFQDKFQISDTPSERIKAAIISEAEHNERFKENLERLVTQYHQIYNANVTQSNSSGVNVNFNNSPGTNVGQQIGNQRVDTAFFR